MKFRVKNWISWRLNQHKHRDSIIYRGVQVDSFSTVSRNCVLFCGVEIVQSNIGKFTYIQKNSSVLLTDIGPFCSIAEGCSIGLANHPLQFFSTSPVFYDSKQPLPKFLFSQKDHVETPKRTTIGADVWIGHGAKIIAGISVGTGAIIGAGAVVTRDVSPYSVVGGVPACQIRMRFSEAICRGLLNSKWWQNDDDTLIKLSELFRDPEQLIMKLGSNT